MNFRLLAVDDKLRQCAELLLETLSCLSLEEQKELAIFLVPEVHVGIERMKRTQLRTDRAIRY